MASRGSLQVLYVYNDYGASREATGALFRALKRFSREMQYAVKQISAKEVVAGDWMKDAALVAIGGGFDRGYVKALGVSGMDNIQRYVTRGGAYLGLCSGAYFACTEITYDKGGKNEVIGLPGQRRLKFFPGKGIGPMFHEYDYFSEKGSDAIRVDLQEPLEGGFYSYFSGGGYFELYNESDIDKTSPSKITDIQVLARYNDTVLPKPNFPGNLPAVVKCNVGNGVAILSGVHFEYEIEDTSEESEYIKDRRVREKMNETLAAKASFVDYVFKLLLAVSTRNSSL